MKQLHLLTWTIGGLTSAEHLVSPAQSPTQVATSLTTHPFMGRTRFSIVNFIHFMHGARLEMPTITPSRRVFARKCQTAFSLILTTPFRNQLTFRRTLSALMRGAAWEDKSSTLGLRTSSAAFLTSIPNTRSTPIGSLSCLSARASPSPEMQAAP